MISATDLWNMDGLSVLHGQSRTVTGAVWQISARKIYKKKQRLFRNTSDPEA